jgi:hypothetical protein
MKIHTLSLNSLVNSTPLGPNIVLSTSWAPSLYVWFEVLIAMTMKMCSPVEVQRRFGGSYHIHPCLLLVVCLAYSLALKMEVVHPSEMSLNFYQTKWRHIPADRKLFTFILNSSLEGETHTEVQIKWQFYITYFNFLSNLLLHLSSDAVPYQIKR